MDEATLQAQVEGASIKIKAKAQDKIKDKDRGMINLKSNVIIVKSIGIKKMNVGRNRVTWVINPVVISLKKISVKRSYF